MRSCYSPRRSDRLAHSLSLSLLLYSPRDSPSLLSQPLPLATLHDIVEAASVIDLAGTITSRRARGESRNRSLVPQLRVAAGNTTTLQPLHYIRTSLPPRRCQGIPLSRRTAVEGSMSEFEPWFGIGPRPLNIQVTSSVVKEGCTRMSPPLEDLVRPVSTIVVCQRCVEAATSH